MTERNKGLKRSAFIAIMSLLVLLAAIGGATYAWFTFTTSARVEPLAGTVSGGGVNLLISNQFSGPYDVSCELLLDEDAEQLEPVTTSDLTEFYAPVGQDEDGIPSGYRNVTQSLGNYLLSGKVYLLSEDGDCRVYFRRAQLHFGDDPQVLAALRFGMRITGALDGTHTYIFKLDDMGDTSGASAQWTIERHGTVYGGSYVTDPAEDLSEYFALSDGEIVSAGGRRLCSLASGAPATVEYWLYLEGCDPNCINAVQSRDLALQMGFAGVEL